MILKLKVESLSKSCCFCKCCGQASINVNLRFLQAVDIVIDGVLLAVGFVNVVVVVLLGVTGHNQFNCGQKC